MALVCLLFFFSSRETRYSLLLFLPPTSKFSQLSSSQFHYFRATLIDHSELFHFLIINFSLPLNNCFFVEEKIFLSSHSNYPSDRFPMSAPPFPWDISLVNLRMWQNSCRISSATEITISSLKLHLHSLCTDIQTFFIYGIRNYKFVLIPVHYSTGKNPPNDLIKITTDVSSHTVTPYSTICKKNLIHQPKSLDIQVTG